MILLNHMKKSIWKSIGAGFMGIVVGASLSLYTDSILQHKGIIPANNLWVSSSIIWFIIFYRSVYNAIGCYIVAYLAPQNPMKHALILGGIGTVASIIGALATMNINLGPQWYAWTLALLTMPSAYLGGKLYVWSSTKE